MKKKDELEIIIDAIGLKSTLELISIITEEKAEHLMTNWQDQVTAAAWRRSGRAIDRSINGIEV